MNSVTCSRYAAITVSSPLRQPKTFSLPEKLREVLRFYKTQRHKSKDENFCLVIYSIQIQRGYAYPALPLERTHKRFTRNFSTITRFLFSALEERGTRLQEKSCNRAEISCKPFVERLDLQTVYKKLQYDTCYIHEYWYIPVYPYISGILVTGTS